MRNAHSISAGLLLVLTVVACGGPLPPPPLLKVTSPARGLVQSESRQLTVTGTALPAGPGDRVTQVVVNRVPAKLAADGSFTAVVDAPTGAMLLETVATSDSGASAVDARAVQTGQLRPVGASIERAVTAALSADAFARLSAVAGPMLATMDLPAMLAPSQPMITTGDDFANLALSVTGLAFTHPKISLAPVDGGLSFSAELDALRVTANAVYAGILVPDGSTQINVSADHVAVTGTLLVAPAGAAGFTTKLASPAVRTVGLKLQASGLTGDILALLDSVLDSTIQSVVTSSAELALEPLINQALGALAGPQRIAVLGQTLNLQASPSALAFTRTGAQVAMNLQARLDGGEASPGYIFTDNGAPAMDPGRGLQLGLADDLVNGLLAQVHALGLLDLDLRRDLGLFDAAEFHPTLPPMISANNPDGMMRLVLGDMIARFSQHGAPVVEAAINAQIELKFAPADDPHRVALQFGSISLRINLIDGAPNPGDVTDDDLAAAASAGIGIQLDSLSELLIELPVPSVAGIQLEQLSIGADSGYVMVSGQIR
jgi:hypothetical protein